MIASRLYLLHRPFLRALDPETGHFAWEFEFPTPTGVGRFFPDGERVIATMGPALYFLEAETGTVIERVDLDFTPDVAVFDHERRIVLGDRHGALICVDAGGRVKWRIESEGVFSSETVCRGAGGEEIWRRRAPSSDARVAVGLGVGDVLVQPDRHHSDGF